MKTRKTCKVVSACSLCGTCLEECPADAVSMTPDGAAIDPEKCTGCGRCLDNCASEAIAFLDKAVNQPK